MLGNSRSARRHSPQAAFSRGAKADGGVFIIVKEGAR